MYLKPRLNEVRFSCFTSYNEQSLLGNKTLSKWHNSAQHGCETVRNATTAFSSSKLLQRILRANYEWCILNWNKVGTWLFLCISGMQLFCCVPPCGKMLFCPLLDLVKGDVAIRTIVCCVWWSMGHRCDLLCWYNWNRFRAICCFIVTFDKLSLSSQN